MRLPASASMPENQKQISKEETSELCGLLKKVTVESENIDTNGSMMEVPVEQTTGILRVSLLVGRRHPCRGPHGHRRHYLK
jgi:hypothetical protein